MATSTEIRARIAEAEAARHARMTGKAVTDVWKDGRRVRYATMTDDEYVSYIAGLNVDLGNAELAEGATPTRRRRGAIPLAWLN